METATRLDVPFSTADAEYPTFYQARGEVRVAYKDWQENSVKLVFSDAIAVKWQMAFTLLAGERDDESYVIQHSDWIKAHIEQGTVTEEEHYQHFRLNFNELGQLEVIAVSVAHKT